MGLLNSRWQGALLSELSVNSERQSGLFHHGDLSQASLEMEVVPLRGLENSVLFTKYV